jgi:hypothetical protein
VKISLTYTYIHAEKLSEQAEAQLNVNIQVTFPVSTSISGDELVAEFLANVSSLPAFFTVSLKGKVSISAPPRELQDLHEKLKTGKTDPQLLQMLTSNIFFETMLLLRELGIPPSIPVPQPPQTKPEDTTKYHV